MDDDNDIPPLSNQIIQFLRAIALPEDNNRFPQSPNLQQSNNNNNNRNPDHNGSYNVTEEDEFRRSQRRHGLRLRLRNLGLSAGRHDRILDWAELLLQLEDQSVTFGLQRLEFDDSYNGNPDDYVDVAAYNSLLQTLADGDGAGAGTGAPPASQSVINSLETVEVNETVTEICAVCNYGVFNNEDKVVKQLPCGHLYHGVCITPWLNSRNTCPVCRHELATDDAEYEQGRLQRSTV